MAARASHAYGSSQAQPAIRSPGREPLGQAETRPMQGAQLGRSRWNASSAIRATLGPAQLHVTTWSSLQRKLGTEKQKIIRGDRLEHQRTLVDLNLSILASRGESSPSSMAIVVEDGIIESRPCLISVLIPTPLFTAFKSETEVDSAQSLLRATRPLPRRVAFKTTRKTRIIKRQCSHSSKWKRITQPTLQQLPRSAESDSEPNVNLQSRPETIVPFPFPSRTISARKPESDEELLKMFRKVEINIPLLDAIKQVPKYAKFLKEFCVHKRRKIKGSKEIGGVVSALTRNEAITTGAPTLPKKCRDWECTIADAMLDLGASINVMPASIYKSLNFCNLEHIGMTIQLANRSIVQPLGVLEDVLIQVNKLIFPTDFYVLDMEDETSGKESTLILGRPFLMTARTKIDVHAGMLSMEFDDTLIVEEYLQLNSSNADIEKFAKNADESSCLGVVDKEADYEEAQDL
ncbi:hypothetical protein CR513_03612, partial [Mucuna pruriens]